MYYRTFINDIKGNLNYLTVSIDRNGCEEKSIEEVFLRDDAESKLKAQITNIFNQYYRKINPELKKKDLIEFLDFILDDNITLVNLNTCLFHYVYEKLNLKTKILYNHSMSFNSIDNKTTRLIKQLEYYDWTDDEKIYISGSSGLNYVELDLFNKSRYNIVFQKETTDDYYHGSILHYLWTMPIDEVLKIIDNTFIHV